MKQITRGLIVLAGLTALACSPAPNPSTTGGGTTGGGTTGGGTTGGGTGGEGLSADLDSAATQLTEVVCSRVDQCFKEAAALFGLANCEEATNTALTNQVMPVWQAAIDKGTAVYKGDKLTTCLNTAKSLGCEQTLSGLPPECSEVIEGQVELGGACENDIECQGTATCDIEEACAGTCIARAKEGESCDTADCEFGFACDDDDVCTAPPGAGTPCGGTTGINCVIGLVCGGATDTEAGTCQELTVFQTQGEGQVCDTETLKYCKSGLFCVAKGEGMNITAECSKPFKSGGPCSFGFPNACPSDEYCLLKEASVNGTCNKLPVLGETCLPDAAAFGIKCAPGLLCPGESCVEVGRLGDACETKADCASGVCTDAKCVAPGLCQ